MNRLNFAALKPVVAKVLGVCLTDSRISSYVNEAQERLMNKGKWVGTTQRYRICQCNSCFSWPRQIETIEAWWLCETPMMVRDKWYEAVGNGPGMQTSTRGSVQLIDRGTACTFRDPAGSNSFINVLASVPEAADAKMLIQGYDELGQWIRTEYPSPGTWIDGEYVAINNTGTRSTKKIPSITGVVKPITNGPVGLYEWPQSLGSNFQQLAFYESDETLPMYRRSLIPNLDQFSCCTSSCDNACDTRSITVMAKLRHIPVRLDTDWLILGNAPAFKLMVQAILKEERNLFAEAQVYEAKAIKELNDELSSYDGDGMIPVMRMQDSAVWGGGVLNDIEYPWPSYPYWR